ncbi:hypothetical protein [Pararhodobacter sp. SW119]|uniref:hypothetical protein n=1 Tax=Pararhodobacter sp. SW119 TaxID=2780075 RepID=UPI001AE021A2|nr:hypothetical protein [Pararhodobacter sp. SW119]
MKQETTTINKNELELEQARERNIARFMIETLTKAADRFATLQAELEAGEHQNFPQAKVALDEFTKLGTLAVNDRGKFYKYLKGELDDAGIGELDLGAARAEIRRRMDRLRTSAGAGSVPE